MVKLFKNKFKGTAITVFFDEKFESVVIWLESVIVFGFYCALNIWVEILVFIDFWFVSKNKTATKLQRFYFLSIFFKTLCHQMCSLLF
jgi:hypothetical protein